MTDSKCILDEGLREIVGKVGSLALNEVLERVAKSITSDIGRSMYMGSEAPSGGNKSKVAAKREEAVFAFKEVLTSQIKELIKEELRKDGGT